MNKKFWQGLVTGLGLAAVIIILVFGIYLIINSAAKKDSDGYDKNYISIDMEKASDGRHYTEVPLNKTDQNPDNDAKDGLKETGDTAVEEKTAEQKEAEESAAAQLFEDKLNYMLKTIKKNYYNDVDDSVMYEAMLKSLVSSLGDPYSYYFTPDELSDLLETTSGEYYGIGAVVSQNYQTKVMTVAYTVADSPAYEVGLLPGDILVAVNGENIEGENLSDVVRITKGPEGTTVDLTISRDGEEMTFTITRRKIQMTYVSHKMLEDDIGYIVLSEFYDVTQKQLTDSIAELESQGMKSLIIDLRGNPGGLYDSVIGCLDRFIEKDRLLVYTEDKYGNRKNEYSKNDDHLDIPIVLLVDGGSASAAEIFTICMQEYGKAKVVGTQTFGKGIVQSLYPIYFDNSAIKITVSRYFSPNGVCIHGAGITPDYVVELPEDQAKLISSLREKDDQLEKALELLRQ